MAFCRLSPGKVSSHPGDLAHRNPLYGRNAGKVLPLKSDLAHRTFVYGRFGQEIGHFSARAAFFGRSGWWDGCFFWGEGVLLGEGAFSAGRQGASGRVVFCRERNAHRFFGGGGVFFWERGRVPLFQKLEFRELFAEVGAVGEGDGVDADGLGGGDICGVVVDEDAVGGLQ